MIISYIDAQSEGLEAIHEIKRTIPNKSVDSNDGKDKDYHQALPEGRRVLQKMR
jgi:hypothetical protein